MSIIPNIKSVLTKLQFIPQSRPNLRVPDLCPQHYGSKGIYLHWWYRNIPQKRTKKKWINAIINILLAS